MIDIDKIIIQKEYTTNWKLRNIFSAIALHDPNWFLVLRCAQGVRVDRSSSPSTRISRYSPPAIPARKRVSRVHSNGSRRSNDDVRDIAIQYRYLRSFHRARNTYPRRARTRPSESPDVEHTSSFLIPGFAPLCSRELFCAPFLPRRTMHSVDVTYSAGISMRYQFWTLSKCKVAIEVKIEFKVIFFSINVTFIFVLY